MQVTGLLCAIQCNIFKMQNSLNAQESTENTNLDTMIPLHRFFFFNLLIFGCTRSSLLHMSFSLVGVCGPLTAAASLVEHGL